jgi:hypothetical protein
MRAQICCFVSIAFSFVAWGVVAGSRNCAGEGSKQAITH